jgi:hypothetical protein
MFINPGGPGDTGVGLLQGLGDDIDTPCNFAAGAKSVTRKSNPPRPVAAIVAR